jgi:uncharacterized iron-regulated protein
MIRAALVLVFCAVPLWADQLSADQRADMARAQIVLLGEIHDNPLHHKGQASLIRQLGPKAVVFEMLSPAQAKSVNADTRDDLNALAARIGWKESGWPDFALYAPVFDALGQTPVVGAAASRDKVRAAFSAGAAPTFGEDAADFGLDTPLLPKQLEVRKALQFDAHCKAMPAEMMEGMVEAQRFRDAHFSKVTLDALARYGAPVIMIAGSGHTRKDWGMPALIALAAPHVETFVVGFVEQPQTLNDPRFSATIATAPADRKDPCDAFN